MKKRTRGRELALKYLYGRELDRHQGEAPDFSPLARDQEKQEDVREFAREIVEGVNRHGPALRPLIEKNLKNWSWRRLGVIDRVLLLIGALELLHRDDIPAQVTINEIVELAKLYGGKNSGAFVNGVLDAVARSR